MSSATTCTHLSVRLHLGARATALMPLTRSVLGILPVVTPNSTRLIAVISPDLPDRRHPLRLIRRLERCRALSLLLFPVAVRAWVVRRISPRWERDTVEAVTIRFSRRSVLNCFVLVDSLPGYDAQDSFHAPPQTWGLGATGAPSS